MTTNTYGGYTVAQLREFIRHHYDAEHGGDNIDELTRDSSASVKIVRDLLDAIEPQRDGDLLRPVARWVYNAVRVNLDLLHGICREFGCPQGEDVAMWLRDQLSNAKSLAPGQASEAAQQRPGMDSTLMEVVPTTECIVDARARGSNGTSSKVSRANALTDAEIWRMWCSIDHNVSTTRPILFARMLLAASPVEQPTTLTAQQALAAIETLEIVGESNDSREPNDDDRFLLHEFIAHAFGSFPVTQPSKDTSRAWEYSFIHNSGLDRGDTKIGPCLTYERSIAFGVGCIEQREVFVSATGVSAQPELPAADERASYGVWSALKGTRRWQEVTPQCAAQAAWGAARAWSPNAAGAEEAPRYTEWLHLRAHGAWPNGVPEWARDHSGRMNDFTAASAVIEELAALARAPRIDVAGAGDAFDIALTALREYQRNWDTGLPAEYAQGERIAMECACEAVREALEEAREAIPKPPSADAAAAPADAHAVEGVRAWETNDGRVISDRHKQQALRDGGASASSVRPFSIALGRIRPVQAVEAVAWVRKHPDTGKLSGDWLWNDVIEQCRKDSGVWFPLGFLTAPRPPAPAPLLTRQEIAEAWKQGGSEAVEIALRRAAARPTDDELWDQTLRERDEYHEAADKLAAAIAKHFGVDIGEHSHVNCPWNEALEVIENAVSASALVGLTEEQIKTLTDKWAARWGTSSAWDIRRCIDNALREARALLKGDKQ
ncbi:hypothetical protein KPA94_20625 [Burkholderia semiarida]|uniref:hypothetical protein n=1 Tax=Burkholderia semiarida TaxID=2843303 RepID=UPI0023DDAA8D|nr:hypothetical protein [Burkholderia semiarida]MDF3115833.1 hypothetical protein [Burkholderia semiarida]